MSASALAESRRVPPAPTPAPIPPPEPTATPVPPISHDGRQVSEEAYWREYYLESDIHYEWNNGRLEEKPVSDFETITVYRWFMELLSHFLRVHPIAKLICLEMGFRLPLPTGTVIRKPDFAVVRNDNPQPVLPLDCSYHGVFDLCVEALSDKDGRGIERDTLVKRAEYGAGGVPEYYILHQEPERLAFYTRVAGGLYVPLEPEGGVIRSRVLPGFRFRPDDLIRQSAHETLRADPVYADYVLPGWRVAEERAAAEAERADAEALARHAAEERAAAETQARLAAERQAREAMQALAQLQAQRTQQPGEGGPGAP